MLTWYCTYPLGWILLLLEIVWRADNDYYRAVDTWMTSTTKSKDAVILLVSGAYIVFDKTLAHWIFLGNHKNKFMFTAVFRHWGGEGSRKYFSRKTGIYSPYVVKSMAVGDARRQGTSSDDIGQILWGCSVLNTRRTIYTYNAVPF